MISKIEKIFLVSVFFIMSVCAFAQSGTYGAYSPYSIYGIGEISKQGTAYNRSMGGVGIAARNNRFINITNPAAVTARDTLSFMADFGLTQKNTLFSQGELRSAKNTFNIYDFAMSFPIWKSSAFMVGITPFSDVGYDFSHIEDNHEIIGNTGNITYDSYGTGSVYQLFLSAGATFWKRFSVGAELIYYFGNIDKVTNMDYSDASYRSINSGSDLAIRGATGKFFRESPGRVRLLRHPEISQARGTETDDVSFLREVPFQKVISGQSGTLLFFPLVSKQRASDLRAETTEPAIFSNPERSGEKR